MDTTKVDLMRPIEELERDYFQIVRNLDAETIRKIEAPTLPESMRESAKLRSAHEVYCQIRAYKGDPDYLMWQPV